MGVVALFSLPAGCVGALRERVVRMLAVAAAAVAARVGMAAVVCTTKKSGVKKKTGFFHCFSDDRRWLC